MKRVLFVFGNVINRYFIPAAIPALAAVMKHRKVWEGKLFDSRDYHRFEEVIINKNELDLISVSPPELLVRKFQEEIDWFKPDLIAITVASYVNYQYLLPALTAIRIPKGVYVIIGGSNVTISPNSVLNHSHLYDLVCIGEGEGVFNDVLERIEQGKSLEGIESSYFIDRSTGQITSNPKRRLIPNPWTIEEDFSLFTDDKYYNVSEDYVLPVEASRGCPYECNYCGNTNIKKAFQGHGKFVRVRTVENLLSFLEKMLKLNPQIKRIKFIDECFLHKPQSWLDEFSSRYPKTCGLPLTFDTRAEHVTENTIRFLHRCEVPMSVSIGVESGCEYILKDVCNRTCSIENVRKAFKLLHEADITTTALIMVGLPFETRESAFKTIELIRDLQPRRCEISVFHPYPGTVLAEKSIKAGFISEKGTQSIKIVRMTELQERDKDSEFSELSSLNMPPPYLSADDINHLRRVYPLYVGLPKSYYPAIEMCEKSYQSNKRLYKFLMDKVKLSQDGA